MVGELLVTFCEREREGAPRAIELWAYPDGTLNLVVATSDEHGQREWVFPCADVQLRQVLHGRPLFLEGADAVLRVERREDEVCAKLTDRHGTWRQCLEVDALEEALDRMLLMVAMAS